MFLGHYAFGLFVKKKYKEIPLWVIFIFVQLIDIFWSVFVLLGLERVRFQLVENPFLRPVFEHYPLTHSLLSNLLVLCVIYFLVLKIKNKRWAMGLSFAFISHWFLDLIVHAPDLPINFGELKVGIGLWSFPVFSLFLEILFFLVLLIYLVRGLNKKKAKRYYIMSIFFILGYVSNYFAPAISTTNVQVGLTSLFLFTAFALVGYWVEKK